MSTPADHHARPNPAFPLVLQTIRVPRVIQWPLRRAKVETPKARLKRWLEKARRVWDVFQASRKRDAVYEFLAIVFDIVTHYKRRRKTNRLLRHAFEFANLPFEKNADPFAAVIRCTSGGGVDNKTISKWSRALQYVAHSKPPDMRLKTFMKEPVGSMHVRVDMQGSSAIANPREGKSGSQCH